MREGHMFHLCHLVKENRTHRHRHYIYYGLNLNNYKLEQNYMSLICAAVKSAG